MKTIRKIISILLLVTFVLLLPVSVLLKNIGSILYSAAQVEKMVGEYILTDNMLLNVFQPFVTSEAEEFDKTSTLQMAEAWDSLEGNDWETVIEELSLVEDITGATKPVINSLIPWLKGNTDDPGKPLDLNSVRSKEIPTEAITNVVINKQSACSPEQNEMFYPLVPRADAIVSAMDHLSFLNTIYEITVSNPNQYNEYILDDIEVGDHVLSNWLTVYITPRCTEIFGKIIPPSSELVCNFESKTIDQPEVIQDELTIYTTRVEPDELIICAPSENLYDGIADIVNPANTTILSRALEQFPEEIDISTFLAGQTRKVAIQTYKTGTYGWLVIFGVFIVAVLIGAGFTKDIFKWTGWPLLVAGLLTMGIAYYLNSAVDVLWSSISPFFAQAVPEYLFDPIRVLYTDALALVSAPTMKQGTFIATIGLAIVIIALVFSMKRSDDIKN